MKIYYFQFLILKSFLFIFVNLQKEDLNFKYSIIEQNYFVANILINYIPTIFWINPEEENITLKRKYKILKKIENDDSSSSFDEESIIEKILNNEEFKEKYNEYIKIEEVFNITSFDKQKCNFTPKFIFDSENKFLNILGLKNLKYLKDNQIIDYETYSFNDIYFSLGKKTLFHNNEQNFYLINFSDNFSVKFHSIKIQNEEIPINVDLKIKLDSLDNFYLILDSNYIETFINFFNNNNNKCKRSLKNSKIIINCENLISTNIDINLNNEIYISIPIEKEDNNDLTTIIFQNNIQNPYLNILKLAKENRLEFLINTNEKIIEIIGNSTNINIYSPIEKEDQPKLNHKTILIIILFSFSLIIIIILVIILYKKYCKKEDQNFYYNINKTSIVVE